MILQESESAKRNLLLMFLIPSEIRVSFKRSKKTSRDEYQAKNTNSRQPYKRRSLRLCVFGS